MHHYKLEWFRGGIVFEEELHEEDDLDTVIHWLDAFLVVPNNIRSVTMKEDGDESGLVRYVSFKTDAMDGYALTPLEV